LLLEEKEKEKEKEKEILSGKEKKMSTMLRKTKNTE